MARDPSIDALMYEAAGGRVSRAHFFRRAAALGLSLPAASALLAACGGSGSSGSGPASSASVPAGATKSLSVRTSVDMANLDPAFWPALQDGEIADCILEGLVSFKPGTQQLVNTLAEEFEPSSDHLSYRFKLKQGIPFHGGYGEVTAEDVKYSYERIAGLTKPNLHAVYQGDWAALKEVKTDGKYAGTIVLKSLFSPLLTSTLPVMSGKVLSKKAVESLGKKFATHPIGTGPYEFVEWVPQQKTVLKKFAQYGKANSAYASPATFEQIVIQPITNDNSAANAMQAGDIEYGEVGTPYVDQLNGAGLNTVISPTFGYQFLSMNVKDPQLSNINLRKAIRQAIDVPGILQAAYNGKWVRANAIIPKEMGIGYWSGAPEYNRDVNKAKQYLKAAGMSGGLDLRLALVNAQADETAAQVIQQNLADIGITVHIQAQDSATFYAIPGAGGGGPHRQLVYSGYITEPDPSWSFVWFTKAQIGLWNWTEWSDPTFEANYTKATQTFDTATRDQLYTQMQQIWDESASIIWIAYQTDINGGKKYVKPSIRPDGSLLLWNFSTA
jgi:peptide/nickel transport system substrate-binding protein